MFHKAAYGLFRDLGLFLEVKFSKSITDRRHRDSWISTSSGTRMIMHFYLSTTSSRCAYHHQMHFLVSRVVCFALSIPYLGFFCILIYGKNAALGSLCIRYMTQGGAKDQGYGGSTL